MIGDIFTTKNFRYKTDTATMRMGEDNWTGSVVHIFVYRENFGFGVSQVITRNMRTRNRLLQKILAIEGVDRAMLNYANIWLGIKDDVDEQGVIQKVIALMNKYWHERRTM